MRETLSNKLCKSILIEVSENNEKECFDLLNSYSYKVQSKRKIYENSSSTNIIFEL